MKSSSVFFIILLSLLTFSCADDFTNMGVEVQPTSDAIIVDTATLALTSENYYPNFMYSRPDSLLLGTFVDETYGTVYADILTQVEPPVDFSYPPGSVADSAKIILYYYTWFGNQYSPMEVNIYEMNKDTTFLYSNAYKSDINIFDYTDLTQNLSHRIFSAKDATIIRDDATTIEFPLNQDFVQRFSDQMKIHYTDNGIGNEIDNGVDTLDVAKFQKMFNGLYITTDFGTASLLYIRGVVLRYYFHYKYLAEGDTDSTTVNTYVNYPANKEVRTINRFQHPDRETVKQRLNATDTVNYLSSPTNVYTKINIPLKKLQDSINAKIGDKTLLLNRAILRIDATDIDTDPSDVTPILPTSIILIKGDTTSYNDFFENRDLPSNTTAILARYSSETNDTTDVTNYYYSFDLAPLLTNELKKHQTLPDTMSFMVVPVSLKYDGSSSIMEVKPQNLIKAVKLCSGSHPTKPMKLNLVYSGF
ncbi:MAG: DUF4270 domain-containing protein [Paludibacter sp.]|nr:DUF4270 domain-containing protein [Paludibacter sp.]